MDITTERGAEAVTVLVDGEALASLDREWWDDWTDRIDGAPEACLESCLASKDRDEVADEDLRATLDAKGAFEG